MGDNEIDLEKKTPNYIGVTGAVTAKWRAVRWSKNEGRQLYNGSYKDKETAAHASDTLARKLTKNGEQNHKLNFPDDNTEKCTEENQTSKRKRSGHKNLGNSI